VETLPWLGWPQLSRAGLGLGLLAAMQSFGNLAASHRRPALTAVSPRVAFAYLIAWMVLALIGLLPRQSAGARPSPCLVVWAQADSAGWTGSPARAQALNPPIRSVARCRPKS
jgi:hypothetical protein